VTRCQRTGVKNLQTRGGAGQILIHGKGGRTRVVFLPVGIWGQLLGLRATAGLDAPVFASRSGKPLERSRVTRIVREASQRAGIAAAVSTHWLRHAHASHALDRGAPIHLVQATLGHRSVAATSRYPTCAAGEVERGICLVVRRKIHDSLPQRIPEFGVIRPPVRETGVRPRRARWPAWVAAYRLSCTPPPPLFLGQESADSFSHFPEHGSMAGLE
jgi:hypothetical protein